MDIILKYYPEITSIQKSQFESLYDLYNDWNTRINVISRKDIDNIYLHHVLHSLSLMEIVHFVNGTKVLDLGCGGGFPGIPLAIMFPGVDFHLVDSIGKKLKVCDAVSESIGLKNVHTTHARGESLKGFKYDFVVSRAAMSLDKLISCSSRLISSEQFNSLSNGIIALKGGDLSDEISGYESLVQTWDINEFYEEDYFNEKKIVYVNLSKDA